MLFKKTEKRSDFLGISVKDRILYEYALIAGEAKYQTLCYVNFLKSIPSADKKPHKEDQVTQAMKEIFLI